MNVLDLFSGIGGFSLGLERAGMRTVAFCERDEYCRAVLRKHWPDVPCFDDVHTIDADGLARLGRIDLVCGGFPCQPFSVAGKQTGKEDNRYLWPEMRRVVALADPDWFLGENVTGLIALALDDVLADLEALGFSAWTLVIPACAVDARHRRDRTWIIARNTNANGKPTSAVNAEMAELRSDATNANGTRLEIGQGECRHNAPQFQAAERSYRNADANADRESLGRFAESRGQRCEWSPEPAVGRVANGVPRRMDRLRALGNAVVPQVVEEIGRAIMSTVLGESLE
jgi:DNA (cytosine-5)-methyltransferase 1